MTRCSVGALLVTLVLAAGCSDSGKRPAGQGGGEGQGGEPRGSATAGAPTAPAEQVIAIAIAAGERVGAPAMERDVAIPLEEAVGRVPNVTGMRSVSGAQSVNLDVSMASGTNPTAAMGAIQAAVTAAAPRLPAGIPPPEIRMRPARRIWLSAASETLSQDQMASVGDRIAESLSRTRGVRSVAAICGAGGPVVRVVVDPGRLSALGIDVARLRSEVGGAATGVRTIEDLSGAVLATAAGGATVALRDVATVERGARPPRCAATVGGRPALSIEVGLDAQAAAAVEKEIDALTASLPRDVRLTRLSGDVLELHVHPPEGIDRDRLRALGASLAAKIESTPDVSGVIVESGDLPATPGSLAPSIRILVAGTAAPDRVLAAAESPDAAVRVAAGPGATAPFLIQGDDLEALQKAAQTVTAAVARTPGIAAAGVAGAALAPRVRIELDAAAIAARGVQRPDVTAAIAADRGRRPRRRSGRGRPAHPDPPGVSRRAVRLRRSRVHRRPPAVAARAGGQGPGAAVVACPGHGRGRAAHHPAPRAPPRSRGLVPAEARHVGRAGECSRGRPPRRRSEPAGRHRDRASLSRRPGVSRPNAA